MHRERSAPPDRGHRRFDRRGRRAVPLCSSDGSGPGAFVIAGDGFEMLAGPPDLGRILDAHPQFTEAVAGFAGGDRPPGGRPAPATTTASWPGTGTSRRCSGQRIGVGHFALSVDLLIATDDGVQRVRVDPRQPVRPLQHLRGPVVAGRHPVRPPHRPRPAAAARGPPAPGSLLEDVQCLDGDIADFIGSRLFYRKIVGKLWLLAIPFVAVLLLRLFSFFPGVGGLLHHHANGGSSASGSWSPSWSWWRRRRPAATCCGSTGPCGRRRCQRPCGPAHPQRAARAEAARLVTEGYAGMVSGPHPRARAVGRGQRLLRQHWQRHHLGHGSPARLRLPQPFLAVRPVLLRRDAGGVVLEVKLWLREVPVRSPVLLERLALAAHRGDLPTLPRWPPCPPARPGPSTGGPRPLGAPPAHPSRRGVGPVRRRRPQRRLRPALASDREPCVDPWLPFGVHPSDRHRGRHRRPRPLRAGPGGPPSGCARPGRPPSPCWSSPQPTVGHGALAGGFGHRPRLHPVALPRARHFRVLPSGFSRLYMWAASVGLVVVAAAAGVGALFAHGHRQGFDFVFLILVLTVVLVLLVSRPSRESRRTGTARAGRLRPGPGHHRELRRRHPRLLRTAGRQVVVLHREVTRRLQRHQRGHAHLSRPHRSAPRTGPRSGPTSWTSPSPNNWVPSVLAASQSWLPIYRAAGLVDHYIGDEADRRLHDVQPPGQVDEVPARRLQPDQEGRLPGRVLRRHGRRGDGSAAGSCSSS